MNRTCKIFVLTFCLCTVAFASKTMAQDVVWKKNFGGDGQDRYNDVIAVPDGYVAVGYSDLGSFGSFGDWYNYTTNGYEDAIIVKYDNSGNVRWKMHFGGIGNDRFTSVTEQEDGYVAVGYSNAISFGTGDMKNMQSKGTGESAILVKYSKDGSILRRESFGGGGVTRFTSVTAVPDGVVAAGFASLSVDPAVNQFNFAGVTGRGEVDAVIVKYNSNFSVDWRKNFGGAADDYYNAVTAVSDGIVVVGAYFGIYFAGGTLKQSSQGNGDWTSGDGVDENDCFIVKYDYSGNIQWKKAFGGAGPIPRPLSGHQSYESFNSVATVSDGVIVVGVAEQLCFGNLGFQYANSDWKEIAYNGGATIVKFSNTGNVVWKKNFGGTNNYHGYHSIATVPDGVITVGGAAYGDPAWGAYMVKHDLDGNEVWKKKFNTASFSSVSASPGGIATAGIAWVSDFNKDDWQGIQGKGFNDAVLVGYHNDAIYGGSISGQIKYPDGTPIDIPCSLRIIFEYPKSSTGWAYYSQQDVLSDESGKYIFKGVAPGNYIIEAKKLMNGEWIHIINTYYASTLNYNEASILKMLDDEDISGIDITVSKVSIPTGNSSISGYVGYMANSGETVKKAAGFTKSEIEGVEYPVEDINVRLQQYTNHWNTILSTVSVENGYFEFQNLPVGMYRVVLDIVGLEMLSYRVIEITEDGTIIDDLELEITEDGAITIGGEVSITDVNDGNGIAVYPNPTSGLLTICDMRCAICDIAIFDVIGRAVVVAQSQIANRTSHIALDLSNLPAGVYFIRITTENGIVTKKVVKK
ncbi:MAG: T9SS type A sorting domain-containing protein [Bacteroidales bacterium]|nr:T9SS type A sorting domain-containing protein [Bacteroidales bacterium]